MQGSGPSDPTATLSPLRRRRWWVAGVIGVLLLVVYVLALAWVTQRLQNDVEKSIHPVQAIQT